MLNTLFGVKKEMRSGYDNRGRRVGATVVEVKPNFVVDTRTVEKDGYSATVVGFGQKKSVKKPQKGQLKKAGVSETTRFFREVRGEEALDLGAEVGVWNVFKKGDVVKVTGVSKGRGFQGGVKRYNFAGGPKTHGQSDRHRAPGSIGSGTTPGRVLKGKRMAGHMGVETVTMGTMEVLEVDKEKNLLVIKGGLPGSIGGVLRLTNTGVVKGYTPPPEEKPDEESFDRAQDDSSESEEEEENAG